MRKRNLLPLFAYICSLTLGGCSSTVDKETTAAVSFSFESTKDSYTRDSGAKKDRYIDYVFAKENEESLFKKPNDPLQKQGVSGKSLYMDGFSTRIEMTDYTGPTNKITFSTWVAPRGFENLNRYGNETIARGHPRMTSLFNWGHIYK